MAGVLYIVSTPIGNLEDITYRAVRILKEVDLIACEDTRRAKILLAHYGIQKPTTSFHKYTKQEKCDRIIELIKEGKSVAFLVSSGTPLISDPGYNLVRAAIEAEIQVVPIPGVTALICALSVSGLKSDSFIFLGFLPRKSMARKKLLASLIDEPRTLIFYESPHRLMKSLQDIAEVFGNRDIVIARELTKKFEEILRGPAPQVLAELQKRNKIKGEFVILISGEKETIFGKQEQRK